MEGRKQERTFELLEADRRDHENGDISYEIREVGKGPFAVVYGHSIPPEKAKFLANLFAASPQVFNFLKRYRDDHERAQDCDDDRCNLCYEVDELIADIEKGQTND